MLHIENYMDITSLHQQGLSIRAISRQTGWSRQAVRAALFNKVPKPFQAPPKASKLDPYKDHVRQRYEHCALSVVRLLEEIRPLGYQGSRVTLQRFIQSLQPMWKLRPQLTVRFETPPGHQAQADWASCGKFSDPQPVEPSVPGLYPALWLHSQNSSALPTENQRKSGAHGRLCERQLLERTPI